MLMEFRKLLDESKISRSDNVEFSTSVRYEILPQLKDMIEERENLRRIIDKYSSFERVWKFVTLDTPWHHIIQRADRLTRP